MFILRSNATATVTNSTISGNSATAEFGGGGGFFNYGNLTIINSTISGNSTTATRQNSGVDGGGGIKNLDGQLTVANSTITGNKAFNGGGIHSTFREGTLTMSNSIVAGNTAHNYARIFSVPSPRAITTWCRTRRTLPALRSRVRTTSPDSLLCWDRWQINGGPTQTHALFPGSPAIDAGDPTFDTTATPYDQRGSGYARKDGNAVDIGAFEEQAFNDGDRHQLSTAKPNGLRIRSGEFYVGATGESLTYQWRKDGVDLLDGGSISGATTENLTITSATTIDAGTYDVVVSGWDGTATSAAATLALNSAPAITTQPADQSVNSGADVSFMADADGAQSVQWQVSTDNGASFSDISGATDGTLTLSAVTSSQNGSKYRAVFTDACGNPAASGAATLTVGKLPQTITFDAIADETYGDAPFALSASSTSNLPVSFSIVSGPATISGNTLTITGAGAITARAEQSGNTEYNAASNVERSFSVGKAQATITLSDLSQTYTGTAKAATATTNPSGLSVSLTYDTPSNAPTDSGSYAVVATISDANYQGDATGTLVINQKTTSISVLPQTLTYGNSIAEGASVSGGPGSESIVYTLASGNNATSGFAPYSNPAAAGSYTLKAVYAGNTNYAGSTAAANVTVNKVDQVIAWSDPAAIGYGTTLGAAQLNASLTTGDGTLTYNPAAGTTLNAGDNQALRIDASETANYGAAFKIVHINVAKADQTITFGAVADNTYGDAPFALTATVPSSLPITYTVVSGPATISGNTLTITGAGAITVSAAQTGNDQYNGAPSVQRSFNVGKAQATITLSGLSQTYDGTAKAATAKATPEGVNVTLAYSQNGATIVSPTNAGSYTVAASVNDANYQGTATDTLTIAKATPVVTWSNPADIAYGTKLGTAQLNATTTMAGSFVYTPPTDTLLNVGANQNLSATFTPNEANNYATANQRVTINVVKASQTITFANPGTKAFGSAPFNLGGSASSGLAVSYTVISGPATISGSTLTITGTGSLTVQASQSGNTNYNAGQDVTQTFTVNKAALLVTAESKSGTYSDALPALTYTITGFINGDTASIVTGAPALGTTVNVVGGNIMSGAGTYVITPSPGNLSAANYSFSFAPGVLMVGKETTQTDYTGDSYVITAGPTIGTASGIRLAAHLTQQADGALGDITLAKARIELYKFSNTGTTPNFVFGDLAVSSSGNVETTVSLPIDDAYTVRVIVESANPYWTANPIYEGTLTIAYGSTEKRAAGGGWVADSASANGKATSASRSITRRAARRKAARFTLSAVRTVTITVSRATVGRAAD